MMTSKVSARYIAALKRPKMNLTPLIDIFTVILIFLVFGFSPEDAALDAAQISKLPSLSSKIESSDIDLLRVDGNKLYFNREELGLITDQKAVADRFKLIRQSQQSKRPIYIQADRDVSFSKVDLAIQILRTAGESDVKFLGIQTEEQP